MAFRTDSSVEFSAAVLLSGGLDSAVLATELLHIYPSVFPIYVRFGLRWERAELASLERFLESVGPTHPGLQSLTLLDDPVSQIYGNHWSNEGKTGVPGLSSRDEEVYLPGRNILLASKSSIWCRIHEIETLAFGTLKGNPFPDAGPDFFDSMESILNLAMNGRLRIIRPFEKLSKLDVLRRGIHLPLQFTFSCLDPQGSEHCGACNKCAERRRVFLEARSVDPTVYRHPLE